MGKERTKVFVIGVDCASMELLLRWKNDLPNLGEMMRNGVYGRLESTIPPATSPAWNCIFTGKNPGKIGIYDLYMFPFYRGKDVMVTNYTYQDSPSLWDILGAHGKRVGIMNVPTTFPPKKVNGFMVSGGLLLPLFSDAQYTYPPELKAEIETICPGFEVLPFTDLTVPGKEEEFLDKFHRNINKHVQVMKHLMQRFDWDFLTYVFFVTDSVQHYFWRHMDRSHPSHTRKDEKYQGAVKEIYEHVDAAIGELMAVAPSTTDYFVVSDHGGGPLYGEFLINEWLRRKGLLKLRTRTWTPQHVLWSTLEWTKNYVSMLLPRSFDDIILKAIPNRVLSRFMVREQYKRSAVRMIEMIDWSETVAYGFGSAPQIFINLRGREPCGIVEPRFYESLREKIGSLLSNLREEEKGRKLQVKVLKREEIYWGAHSSEAPDLVVIIDDFKYVPRAGFGKDIWLKPRVSGTHTRFGAFVACGPHIAKRGVEIENLSVYDIAPTILHLFGLPIPRDLDGRVVTEIFEEGSEPAARRVVYQEWDERRRIREKVRRMKRTNMI